MKQIILVIIIVFLCSAVRAQEETSVSRSEQQMENLTEQQEAETEDDSFLQYLVQLRKTPINLNTAEENELREMRMLSDLQIQNLFAYKRVLGNLISIYEIQAVPGWDIETIQKVLPYVRVGSALSISADLKQRFSGGLNTVLLRMQQQLEKANGYLRPDSITNRYPGSAQRIFFRYKYTYRNLLQFGITGDKDAGEQFFKGSQKAGFDFYSFHLFARKLGPIKLLAIGDFTVNLGQGLIQWQSLAFKKSVEITAVKRQADIIRPYNSAAEYNFQHGAGITLGGKKVDVTAFASVRRVDATLNIDTSYTNEDYISTILSSGYHRTSSEVAKKNTFTQTSFGGNISYKINALHLGLNAVHYQFSVPLTRDLEPYSQYAIQGKTWSNYSIDYS
ncbi:MAG TPA: helix-hairpin-helix domain-containing protein, partial [Segetibacter sp.]